MSDQPKTTLADLVAGDEVCVEKWHGDEIRTITHVTPKYIYAGSGRYRKTDGWAVGSATGRLSLPPDHFALARQQARERATRAAASQQARETQTALETAHSAATGRVRAFVACLCAEDVIARAGDAELRLSDLRVILGRGP